jgi:molecular chaperone GrpE
MSENSEKKVVDPENEQGDCGSVEEPSAVIEEEPGPDIDSGDFQDLSNDDLVQLLADAKQQIADMKDGYVRARADVENIQRRSQNEIVSARKFAIEGFARELLSVVDSLNQAAMVEMDEAQGEAVIKMKEGLELTLKQFEKIMEKFGIAAVEAQVGTRFDPDVHQAISMVDSNEAESGSIVIVMQKGFTLKDRLLRPAMVVIAN